MFFFVVLLALLFFCTGEFGLILLVICVLIFLCAILPEFLWVILSALILGAILYYFSTKKDRKSKTAKGKLEDQRKAERRLYYAKLDRLIKRFGNCSANINLGNWDECTIKKRLLVFRKSNIIVINGKYIPFSDIVSFSTHNRVNYDYATKKAIWKSKMCINVNSTENPTMILEIEGNRKKLDKITSILNSIINKNKKNIQSQQLCKQL
ncbi:MAG: hypothetical protein K2H46_00475 [Muribaculaceae bacterium]|nr:hypothetical protein [Muribaculaceae bacterium]